MAPYSVTAGNCAHWQTLVVVANSAVEAGEKFTAYLLADRNGEDEEFEMSQAIDSPEHREDFTYSFAVSDIKEWDGDARWTGTPTTDVEMIRSGANG